MVAGTDDADEVDLAWDKLPQQPSSSRLDMNRSNESYIFEALGLFGFPCFPCCERLDLR